MNDSETMKPNYKTAGIIILVLVAIIAIFLLFRSCAADKKDIPVTLPDASGIVYDTNAVTGGWNEADTNEIVASLNKKVEDGMINISMNTTPIFEDGASDGNLMIVNEEVNTYPQVIEITRNDTGELIYKSGAIPVGSKIETARLNTELEAGIYQCTALFYNVDPNTGNYLGCAGAIICITVLN